MAKKRDYKQEYKWQGTEEQKTRRAERNSSRRKLEKAGKVHKGDGKDVDHENRSTGDKSKDNLRVRSRSSNRAHGGRVGNKQGKARGGRQ